MLTIIPFRRLDNVGKVPLGGELHLYGKDLLAGHPFEIVFGCNPEDGFNLQHFDCVSQMSLKYRCNYILTVDCCYFIGSLFSTVSYRQITRAIDISRTFPGFGFFFQAWLLRVSCETDDTSRHRSPLPARLLDPRLLLLRVTDPGRQSMRHRSYLLASFLFSLSTATTDYKPAFSSQVWWDATHLHRLHPGVFCPIERHRSVSWSFDTSGGYSMNPSHAAQVTKNARLWYYLRHSFHSFISFIQSIHIQSYFGVLQSKYTVLHSIH